MDAARVMAVKSRIGSNVVSIGPIIGDEAAAARARKLQKPRAVAAHPTGNRLGWAS